MEFRFCFEDQRSRVSIDEPGRQLLKVASAHHLVDLCLEEASYVVAMLLDQLVRDQISSGLSVTVFHNLALTREGISNTRSIRGFSQPPLRTPRTHYARPHTEIMTVPANMPTTYWNRVVASASSATP